MALCHMNSQGEKKRDLSFDTWQGELMCLKPFFYFDVAPVLAKNIEMGLRPPAASSST